MDIPADGGGVEHFAPYDRDRADARRLCLVIAEDMASDATEMDGKPFNGRTVANYFGRQGAAIAALAKTVAELLNSERHES